MTSSSKSKKKSKHLKEQNSVVGEEAGENTKKVRKKIRRRNDPSSDAEDDEQVKLQNDKMMSFRTTTTATSSSHHSLSPSVKAEDETSGSKRSKKKKSTKESERVHKSEHARSPDVKSSSKSSRDSSFKKKRNMKKESKSDRSIRTSRHKHDDSDDEEKTKTGTVDTSGIGSSTPRPKLTTKHMSQPDLSSHSRRERPGLERQHSGDLDMLMSQRVGDHTRKLTPKSPKPTPGRHTLGKSIKKMFRSKSKDKSNERESFSKSFSEESGEIKPLPKDIREIDGVLWRVDYKGNKLNKVRKKASKDEWESDDEMEIFVPLSEHTNNNIDGSENSFAGFSSGEELGGESNHKKRTMRKGRRSSINRQDSFDDKPDSESSLYLDGCSHDSPQPGRRRIRSKSVDFGSEHSYGLSTSISNSNSDRLANVGDENDRRGLLMRLKKSEQEVSRLLRVTNDQQETIDENESELKRLRKKIKKSNSDKEDLADEIDRLADELEKKETMLLEEKNKPKFEPNNVVKNNDRGNSGSDRLVATICELKQKRFLLEKQMEEEQARADAKMEAKEAEIEFLQQELDRMRSKHGDRQMQQVFNSSSDDEDPDRGGLVGKILGNHLQNQAETQSSLQQQEIRDLQDRVFQLQTANDKLNIQLREASLAVQEDDDEEMRLAKEAAAMARAHATQPQVMRMQRRGSGGGVIPEGFRMQRRGSCGGIAPAPTSRMQRRMSSPDQWW